jgi:hypothetical protein
MEVAMHPSSSMPKEWNYALALPLCAAVAAVAYGALPALREPTSGGTFGFDNLLKLLVWWYGLLGVALCYLGQAAFRVPLGLGSVAGSVIALLYSAMRGAHRDFGGYPNYPLDPDGNMLFLLGCVAGSVLLVWFDRRKRDASTQSYPYVASGLLFVWIVLPLPGMSIIASH